MRANEKTDRGNDAVPPVRCPECGGTERVVLLTRSRPCSRCGGGAAADAGGKDRFVRVLTYDERDRPLTGLLPGGQAVAYTYYDDEGDSDMPDNTSETKPVDSDPAGGEGGLEAGQAAARHAPRPDCGGGGRVVLLTSSRECARCGGNGTTGAADWEADDFGSDECSYDRAGRLTRVVTAGEPAFFRFDAPEGDDGD